MTEFLVYRWFDAADTLLYVGMTNNLDRRTLSHRSASPWMVFAARCEVEQRRSNSRDEALGWEREAIAAEAPIFNRTPEAVGFAARQRGYLRRQGVDWSGTPHARYGEAGRSSGLRPASREPLAPRRLGASAVGTRDKVMPLRLRADELDEIKGMAETDGFEASSWVYLRVQEVLATERRKRRRAKRDTAPDA